MCFEHQTWNGDVALDVQILAAAQNPRKSLHNCPLERQTIGCLHLCLQLALRYVSFEVDFHVVPAKFDFVFFLSFELCRVFLAL